MAPVFPHCERAPLRQFEFERKDRSALPQAIVDALASVDEVEPLDLPPLYNVIDEEALDRLFDHRDRMTEDQPAALWFTTDGKNVCVSNEGSVCVCNGADDAGAVAEETPVKADGAGTTDVDDVEAP